MTSDDLAVLVNQYGIRPAKFLDAGYQLRYLLTAIWVRAFRAYGVSSFNGRYTIFNLSFILLRFYR